MVPITIKQVSVAPLWEKCNLTSFGHTLFCLIQWPLCFCGGRPLYKPESYRSSFIERNTSFKIVPQHCVCSGRMQMVYTGIIVKKGWRASFNVLFGWLAFLLNLIVWLVFLNHFVPNILFNLDINLNYLNCTCQSIRDTERPLPGDEENTGYCLLSTLFSITYSFVRNHF